MSEEEKELRERLENLLDVGISPRLPPEKRLLAAILVRATLDYFDLDPAERRSAAEYFLESWIYPRTLDLFGLPSDYLPKLITIAGLEERMSQMKDLIDPTTLRVKTLVDQLSGNQLKVILTMGTLQLPAAAGKIAAGSQLSRSAVAAALNYLRGQGLVTCQEAGTRLVWSLPPAVANLLSEIL